MMSATRASSANRTSARGGGAKGGLFRLQFVNRGMGRDEFASLMRKLQNERIVSLAVDAQ